MFLSRAYDATFAQARSCQTVTMARPQSPTCLLDLVWTVWGQNKEAGEVLLSLSSSVNTYLVVTGELVRCGIGACLGCVALGMLLNTVKVWFPGF